MQGTELTGLEGTNPLGFLAALGVQTLFEFERRQPRLWWADDVIPHAVIDSAFGLETILEQAMIVFSAWVESPAFNPPFPKGENLKFTSDNLRSYLETTREDKPGNTIATALVAEGSLDKQQKGQTIGPVFHSGGSSFS